MKVFVFACLIGLALATPPIPNELLNEWSQFKADDDFYNQMDAFLETGTTDAGGDFEFKCETTCQLVQKNTAVPDSRAAANTLLQTDEGTANKNMEEQIQNAFYNRVNSFLETESKTGDAGGDFEFKCETTCQLVQKNTAAPSGDNQQSSGSQARSAAMRSTNNFMQEEAGLMHESQAQSQTQVQAQAQAQDQAQAQAAPSDTVKDCFRLCLNPSMNPGCDAAANAVSMLETGTMSETEMLRKNWSLGSGSGNCLNSCVHVCMAVHQKVQS